MSIHYLFPTPLWLIENDGSHPDDMLEWALSLKEGENELRSNRGGFQSEASWDYDNLLHREYLIEKLNFLPKFQFGNWWVNINEKGGFHVAHSHPGADLSVVWYLTDSECGPLRFFHPCSHARDHLNKALNLETDSCFVAKKGDIIVFPSDLWHYVEPNQSDDVRVSISFNLSLL